MSRLAVAEHRPVHADADIVDLAVAALPDPALHPPLQRHEDVLIGDAELGELHDDELVHDGRPHDGHVGVGHIDLDLGEEGGHHAHIAAPGLIAPVHRLEHRGVGRLPPCGEVLPEQDLLRRLGPEEDVDLAEPLAIAHHG